MNKVQNPKLTRRQKQLLSALAEAGDEPGEDILAKLNLTLLQVGRWLDEEPFATAFNRMLRAAHAVTAILRARYAEVASRTLINLCNSKNPETARKASLDILGMKYGSPPPLQKPTSPEASGDADIVSVPKIPIKPETASKLLQVLADEQDEAA